MATQDMLYRLMATDAGAATAFTNLSAKARVAATATQDLTAATLRAADAEKIAADAAARAADLRIRASIAMAEAQARVTAGDTEGAAAARESAEALRLQASAAAATSRELNANAAAAARQAAVIRDSRAETSLSATSIHGLIGESTGLTAAMEKVPTPVTVVAGALGKLGLAAGVTGVAIAGLSIDLATKYQSALTRLATGAGESAKGLAVVQKQLLTQSRELGVGATQLAAAMYPIESAGFHGAAGVRVLHDAVEGALADGADYTTVADAVTSALNSYSLSSKDAASVTNQMVAAVSVGKTTMQDLAGSIGTVIPEAAALKIPFDQVLGAISTMTSQGTNASRAATSLRFALKSLADPASTAIPVLKQIGLSAGQLGDTLTRHGIVAAFTQLEDAVGRKFPEGSHAYLAALANVVGGTRGLTSVLELTGKHLDDFKGKTAAVARAMNQNKSGIEGWSKYTKTFRFNLDAAKAGLEELAISFGTRLLPDATKALHWIATTGINDLQKFGNWFKSHESTIKEWGRVAEEVFKLVTQEIQDAFHIAAAVVDVFEGKWGAAWNNIKTVVTQHLNEIKTVIGGFAKGALTMLFDAGKDIVQGLINGINSMAGSLIGTAKSLASKITAPFRAALHLLSPSKVFHGYGVNIVQGLVNGVKSKIVEASDVARLLAEGMIHGWTGAASRIKDALTTPIQDALTHLTTVLDNQLSKQEAALKKSEQNYTSLVKARKQAITSLQQSITGNTDISNVLGMTDANGNSFTGNVGSFLTSQLGPLRTEAHDLALLRKRGLSQQLLAQISAMSPQDAVTIMQQILSGQDGSIASLNQTESLIQRYAKQSATTVVESPHERQQLATAKHQEHTLDKILDELRKQDRRREREAARAVAHDVTIKVDGRDLKLSDADGREIVKILNKLAKQGVKVHN